MIGFECLNATAEISERSDAIRAFPKRSKSSCNFAQSAPGLDHEINDQLVILEESVPLSLGVVSFPQSTVSVLQ